MWNKKEQLHTARVHSTYGGSSENDDEEDFIINVEEESYDSGNAPKNINSNDKKMHKKLESLAKNTIFRSLKKKPLTNIEIIHI